MAAVVKIEFFPKNVTETQKLQKSTMLLISISSIGNTEKKGKELKKKIANKKSKTYTTPTKKAGKNLQKKLQTGTKNIKHENSKKNPKKAPKT